MVGLAVLVMLPASCAERLERTLVKPTAAATLDKKSPYLKIHMKSGELYVLTQWSMSPDQTVVTGMGEHFDWQRNVLGVGPATVQLADVALLETNVTRISGPGVAMAIITGLSVAVTTACAINPKACFGSCPTFYVSDGKDMVLQAEGFSSSIAPSLEARDIDALYRARPRDRRMVVRMTNEAFETHVVRHVELLAVQRPAGGRVATTADGRFWQITDLSAPARCTAAEGECTAAVSQVDEHERFSYTDARNLAEREYIELGFEAKADAGGARLGLVVEARQTLLSTFLFYQALAYMGRRVGEIFAALERGDAATLERARQFRGLLGGIEVQLMDEHGGWQTVGELDETGPLATDVQMILLPPRAGAERIRLRLTQGHWRLGYVALARVADEVLPRILQPQKVEVVHGNEADARGALLDPERTLITLPGDDYRLEYELPAEPETWELFLASRGYYLEWMREEWVREEDPAKAALLLHWPELMLRLLAPAFKKVEPEMEGMFWKSRYVRQ